METITVTINFTGAEGGTVLINILGPHTDLSYNVDADQPNPPRNFTLAPAIYSISVHGVSGGTLGVTVDQNGERLVDESCPPPNLYVLKAFEVKL
ncbi:MAG: hypothetical protein JWQ63_1537 [Mucilaginibacter sp.]|nr:hypothetical protein [Mucilaginibacter sp.]